MSNGSSEDGRDVAADLPDINAPSETEREHGDYGQGVNLDEGGAQAKPQRKKIPPKVILMLGGILVAAIAVLAIGLNFILGGNEPPKFSEDVLSAPDQAEVEVPSFELGGSTAASAAGAATTDSVEANPPSVPADRAGDQVAESQAPDEAASASELDALRMDLEDLERRLNGMEDQLRQVKDGSESDQLDKAIEEIEKSLANQSEQLNKLSEAAESAKKTATHVAAKQRQAEKRVERRKSKPPYDLVTIEMWDGRPNAVVEMDGRVALLAEGDSSAGWHVRTIHFPDSAVFVRKSDGREVKVMASGRVSE